MATKLQHPTESDASQATGVRGRIALSLLIMAIGIGWLLTTQGVMTGVDWVWTFGLGVIGVAVFLVSGGIDKVSLLLGPLFLISSVLSILRQTGRLDVNTEMPILVILVGVLLLIVQSPAVPLPRWLTPLSSSN